MLKEQDKQALFEQTVLRHIDAAFNLARWMIKNDQDAEDIVQESFLRAYKYFSGYQGGNSRSWLLTIVRNTCYTWLHENQAQWLAVDLNEEISSTDFDMEGPEQSLQIKVDQQSVVQALEKLPVEYRELIVLRELEEMSYKEIALIAGVPIGTVMSRLARARRRLKACLAQQYNEEGSNEL
jgi:RNA polymerase sigma-70 factor (ECF subfamily)